MFRNWEVHLTGTADSCMMSDMMLKRIKSSYLCIEKHCIRANSSVGLVFMEPNWNSCSHLGLCFDGIWMHPWLPGPAWFLPCLAAHCQSSNPSLKIPHVKSDFLIVSVRRCVYIINPERMVLIIILLASLFHVVCRTYLCCFKLPWTPFSFITFLVVNNTPLLFLG